jgi:hypothetical protein
VETFVFIVATITVTLQWKRPKLTVMQQAPSRYYGNATRCTDHVTTENLICHIIYHCVSPYKLFPLNDKYNYEFSYLRNCYSSCKIDLNFHFTKRPVSSHIATKSDLVTSVDINEGLASHICRLCT